MQQREVLDKQMEERTKQREREKQELREYWSKQQ